MLRWAIVALGLVTFTTAACAPPTLDPVDETSGASTTKKSSSKKKTTTAGDDDDTTAAGDDDDTTATKAPAKKTTGTGTGTGTAAPAAGAAPASFSIVFTDLSNCSGCHKTGVGGAPIFFGDDAAATYTLFKDKGFNVAGSILTTKGAHNGPSLTATQSSAIDAWIAADTQ